MEFEIQDGVLQKCRLNTGETEAVIPEGVISIGKEAFTECRSLQSISIPEGVTSIGEKAFSYCSRLQPPAKHHHSGKRHKNSVGGIL